MARHSSKRPRNKVGTCLFCDYHGPLTETHIWPAWLNRMLRPRSVRLEELDKQGVTFAEPDRPMHSKLRSGSIFSQRPYLCCAGCSFAKLFFVTHERVVLSRRQRRVFAVWVSLITVLAEFIVSGRNAISVEDRNFIKTRLMPPRHWCIMSCSLNADEWKAKYRNRTSFIGQFTSRAEYFAAVDLGITPNTQLSSFGMGNLFAQVFSCPNERLVSEFEVAAKASGLI